jgi:hypothetical protein
VRGKGDTISDTTTTDAEFTGDDVLAWLDTADAAAQARRLASHRGLAGYDAMTQNVLAEARVAVWQRLRSDEALLVERPGAYGTQVLRSVLRQIAEGRDGRVRLVGDPDDLDRSATVDGDDTAWTDHVPLADTTGDDVRVHLERLADDRAWLTSAALTHLTLLLEPAARPDDAPWPTSGSTEEQARCWPSLWYAGERGLFEGGPDAWSRTNIRRTRARRIALVLERVRSAMDLYEVDRYAVDLDLVEPHPTELQASDPGSTGPDVTRSGVIAQEVDRG